MKYINNAMKIGAVLGLTAIGFFYNAKPTLSQPQSFTECVNTLYRGPYSPRDAANNCIQASKGKPTNEKFTECVNTLYRGPYSPLDAANNCIQAFKGKPINEEFTECVNTLYRGPYSTSDATKYCQEAIDNSASSAPPNNNSPYIIVIPQGQQVQQAQPRERRTRTVCMNVRANAIWDDFFCQNGNRSFEWRTMYLD